MISLYHKVNYGLLGLTPLAFALSPSALNTPIDFTLGVMLPLHAHVGMNCIITDYAKKISKGAEGPLRVVMLGVTGVTLLGILKLNVSGPGLTETVKGLWRSKVSDK